MIERILQMDIKDEKDADRIRRMTEAPGLVVSTRPRTISKANLNLYRHPSMLYDDDNDEENESLGLMRNASVNHVFTSKFMLNFA